MKIKKSNTLGKTERLKSSKLIDALFKGGKGFNSPPFRVLYKFTEATASPLQAGFGVSSRNFKKSVERNRIKRLAREAYRLQKNELAMRMSGLFSADRNENPAYPPTGLAVFFIYTGKTLPDFVIVQQKMEQILEKLMVITHEAFPSNT